MDVLAGAVNSGALSAGGSGTTGQSSGPKNRGGVDFIDFTQLFQSPQDKQKPHQPSTATNVQQQTGLDFVQLLNNGM